jgi:hypothetical protein
MALHFEGPPELAPDTAPVGFIHENADALPSVFAVRGLPIVPAAPAPPSFDGVVAVEAPSTVLASLDTALRSWPPSLLPALLNLRLPLSKKRDCGIVVLFVAEVGVAEGWLEDAARAIDFPGLRTLMP